LKSNFYAEAVSISESHGFPGGQTDGQNNVVWASVLSVRTSFWLKARPQLAKACATRILLCSALPPVANHIMFKAAAMFHVAMTSPLMREKPSDFTIAAGGLVLAPLIEENEDGETNRTSCAWHDVCCHFERCTR